MRLSSLFSIAALVLSNAALAAAEDGANHFTVSGFGTLGYVYSDHRQYGFTRDLSQPRRDGLRERLLPDSRLGLQINYRVDPRFEFAGQLVARDQVDVSLGRSVEWAFAAWHPVPEADLRIGRLGFDVFMLSEYRNVGYAYSWVRPVMEFYSWMPIYSFDGIDASYDIETRDGRWRVKLLGGRSRARTPSKVNDDDYKLRFNPLWGASLSYEAGPWRTKLSYVNVRFDTQPPTGELTTYLETVAASPLPDVAADAAHLNRDLTIAGRRSRYAALGVSYDDNLWLLQAEYSRLSGGPPSVPQGWRGYVSAGRRFGDVTPFAVAAWARPSTGPETGRADWSALPGGAQLQGAAVMAVDVGRIDQHTASLGLRWDFSHTAALKVQWDHSWINGGGWGLWPTANPPKSDIVNLLTTTVDWVF